MKIALAFAALLTLGAGGMFTMNRYQQTHQIKVEAQAPCCDPPGCPPICSK